MPDYQNAMIYKLWSPEGDDIYIGSTTQTLAQRKAKHKSEYDRGGNLTSKVLFEKYTDVRIELIEECPCDKKCKLIAREGHYIRTTDCVNKVVPGRTSQEYKEDNREHIKEKHKEYCENNKEKIKEQCKEYHENNKEKIKEYKKEYRENNKEHIKEKHKEWRENNKEYGKEWRENNKEHIRQHASEKITCECGCEIRRDKLAQHKRTQKHTKLTSNM
tara:strand:- start:158 stop:808 length:651 start_codon:yes stop_codon:yes gene_type:complete